MHLDTMLCEKPHSFWAYVKTLRHPLRQHDYFGSPIDQLNNVGRLDARFMGRPGFAPIPLPGAARKHLDILKRPDAFDLDPSPRNRGDRWRSILAFATRDGAIGAS